MFRRVLVANRGDVALRVAKTCEKLGIVPVLATSDADRKLSYTRAFESICIGPSRASESYLDPLRLIQAAKQTRCAALHPGWGFLSESSLFSNLCEQHGISFVGPPAHVAALMGAKIPAKRAMAAAGLSVIPGSEGEVLDVAQARAIANEVGYPVLLKAMSGGGGRGMRVATGDGDIEQAFNDARAEALAAFGTGALYLEKLVTGGRHVEIQVIADKHGNVIHVGERDCSIQRNHQKLVEESPAPSLSDGERQCTLDGVVKAVASIGYVGAGTMEFLLDGETLRFMEMNTRLQVEHCVSEMRSGLDLVELQLRAAAGEKLPVVQDDVKLKGAAIEVRINAEDPDNGFRPTPGVLEKWQPPQLEDVRVDTHMAEGDEVSPFYDSLLAKVIAFGADRNAAADQLLNALEAFEIEGVTTTLPLHKKILAHETFRSNDYLLGEIPGHAEKGKG